MIAAIVCFFLLAGVESRPQFQQQQPQSQDFHAAMAAHLEALQQQQTQAVQGHAAVHGQVAAPVQPQPAVQHAASHGQVEEPAHSDDFMAANPDLMPHKVEMTPFVQLTGGAAAAETHY